MKQITLPKYKGKIVYVMDKAQLDRLSKVSKDYYFKRSHKTICYTCRKEFKIGEICISRNNSANTLRHLDCAKRVNYV